MRKMTPSTMQMEPTTRYAMPRNGFLPPSHEVVDRVMRFSPSKSITGKAASDMYDYSIGQLNQTTFFHTVYRVRPSGLALMADSLQLY